MTNMLINEGLLSSSRRQSREFSVSKKKMMRGNLDLQIQKVRMETQEPQRNWMTIPGPQDSKERKTVV